MIIRTIDQIMTHLQYLVEDRRIATILSTQRKVMKCSLNNNISCSRL